MQTKEEKKAKKKTYNAAHREERKAYNAANREKINAQKRAWCAANPEKGKARSAAYYAANREQIRAQQAPYQAAYRAANYKEIRADQLMDLYGMSLEVFQLMLLAQKNACGICKNPFSKEEPHVDHCHRTGKVRGLLCRRCNVALGGFKDSAELLKGALDYLQNRFEDRSQ